VLAACGPEAPRCIVDLGGGSLEISILRGTIAWWSKPRRYRLERSDC